MNTITHTVIDTKIAGSPVIAPAPAGADEVTVSMVEVDAAAARAALTEHLRLPAADLEHPSVVAVLAAVVAAGWRPPTPTGTRGLVAGPVIGQAAALFDTDPGVGPGPDSVGIGGDRGGPPGRPR